MSQLVCPDRARLVLYSLGKLPGAEMDSVADHLTGCARCLDIEAGLEKAADELVLRLRKPVAEDEYLREPEWASVQVRLAGIAKDCSTGGVGPDTDFPAKDARPPVPTPPFIGRYRVVALIGQGGMGMVYRGHDPQLNRPVAIKMPLFSLDHPDRDVAIHRFLREAQTAAGVRHPNVCPVYDAGQHDGSPYAVMAFVAGGSLADRMHSEQFSEPEAVVLVTKVAGGLAAIHDKGIVHRDLKPGNILLDETREPLLSDFGLARPVLDGEKITREGGIVGTPAYMAPEQARNRPENVGPAADVYSLGVVLYQLLAGRLPFTGDAVSILVQAAKDDPPTFASLGIGVDPDLEAIVRKALAKKPGDRFVSAAAFADALRSWKPVTVEQTGEYQPASIPVIVDTPVSGGRNPSGETQEAKCQPRIQPRKLWRWKVAVAAGLLLAIGGVTAAQIIIRIRDKDGKVVTEMKVAKDSTVEIEKDGEKIPIPELEKPGVEIPAQPWTVKAGEALSLLSLVQRPAKVEKVQSWTLETRACRGGVRQMAMNPRGDLLATAGHDGIVRILEPDSGRLVKMLVGHPEEIAALAWSRDGKYLATDDFLRAADGFIRIWEVGSGKVLRLLPRKLSCSTSLAWSPDGSQLASADVDGGCILWNTKDGKVADRLDTHHGSAITAGWSMDGKVIATAGGEGCVRLWDATTRKKVIEHKEKTAITSIAWSPRSNVLAIGVTTHFRFWDRTTAKAGPLIQAFKRADADCQLYWSPDGEHIALGTEAEQAFIYEKSGKRVRTTAPNTGRLAAWCRDNKTLVSAHRGGSSLGWQHLDGRPFTTLKGELPQEYAVWSPSGDRVAVGGMGGLAENIGSGSIFDWKKAEARSLSSPGANYPKAWSFDGQLLAVVQNESQEQVGLFEAATGKQREVYSPKARHIVDCAWHPKSRHLAITTASHLIVWDATAKKEILRQKAGKQEESHGRVAWSPTGKFLAVLTSHVGGGSLCLWDLKTREQVSTTMGWFLLCAWSPDEKHLATVERNSQNNRYLVRLRGGADMKEITSFESPHEVLWVVWLADRKTIAVATGDGTVRHWDGADAPKVIPRGRIGVFSPDRKLQAEMRGNACRIVDAATGKPRVTFVNMREGRWLAVSPDGHYTGSKGIERHLVYVIQDANGQETLSPEEFAKKYRWKNDPTKVQSGAK